MQILSHLPVTNLTWKGKLDGQSVEVSMLQVKVGIDCEVNVTYKDATAEHHLTSIYRLLGHGDDSIEIDDTPVEHDDVDFIVKFGFPKSSLWFQFEYADAQGDHKLALQAKVNVAELLKIPIPI
jgi:hypothetical protein